ncbi:MAG: radical SAM protein [Kofleriaceae bacterium]|nr:radical SAM protein [Kofleriaceae bacterium]
MSTPPLHRRLPIAPTAPTARRHLPLADAARPIDLAARPLYAVWEITLACDLACTHCGSRAGKARPDELTTAEALRVVDELAELGVREVTLIGGEAYLRPDWLDLVRAIVARGMRASMATGGRGVTPALATAAAAAGLSLASVSIDGHRAAHDQLRAHDGAYDQALAALTALRAAGIVTSSNCQLNRVSVPTLDALLDDLAAAGVNSWRLQLTAAMGRAADLPEVLLQPYDLLELFPKLAALHTRAASLGVRLTPGNNVGYFGPYEQQLRGGGRGHMTSCRAGITTIGLEANGAMKGCPSLTTASWTGGNVRDEPLRAIWERAAPLRVMRDRTALDLWGFCRTCYYADECRAGCTWTAEVLFGRPGNNPYCHHRALELAARGRRERLVAVAAAPGLPFDHGQFELIEEAT